MALGAICVGNDWLYVGLKIVSRYDNKCNMVLTVEECEQILGENE